MEPYNISGLIKLRLRDLYPTKAELKKSFWPIMRGSAIGFPIGLMPGPAAIMASLVSYKVEKSVSRHPEEFGKGAIQGVAGPESANNAAAAGAMVPLLALGIPFAPPTAILLGGFIIHGVTPGPAFVTQHPQLFWLIIASMYIGNIMLLVLNLPLVGVFASLTKLSPKTLMPIVTAIMFIGVYSVNNSYFDIVLLLIFGLVGFALKIANFSPAPLVIGFVLSRVFEKGLRQSLVLARGDLTYLVRRPIAGTLFAIAFAVIVWIIYGEVRKKKIVLPDNA